MVRPKLILDTNVCISVAKGKIDPTEWQRVQKHINTHYRYYISFVTRKELFSGLARGTDPHFEQNKEPLGVLYRPAKRRFLPYPSVFALRTALGLKGVARIGNSDLTEEEEAEGSFKAVMDAPSKAQLKKGIRLRNEKHKGVHFDLDDFDTQENAPQDEHATLLQGIRDRTNYMPNRKEWAALILHQHGLEPYTEDCEKLALALDAAYVFDNTLSVMATNQKYDFTKHASDWGDVLQLFYLCDEAMHLLTMDADFRHRTKGSFQNTRILLYSEFVRSLPH